MWTCIQGCLLIIRGPLPPPRSPFQISGFSLSSSTAWYRISPPPPADIPFSVPINSPNMDHSKCFPLPLSKHFLSDKSLPFISWTKKSPQCRSQDPQEIHKRLGQVFLRRDEPDFIFWMQGPILSTSLCPGLPQRQDERTSRVGAEVRTWPHESPPAGSSLSSGASITSLGCPPRLASAPVSLRPTALDFIVLSSCFVRPETLSHSPCIFSD